MRTQSRQRRSLKQAGFTLIELIIVIVIIGILAAVAIPQFNSLTRSAQEATTKALAAELGSAAAIYYAKKSVDSTTPTITTCSGLNVVTNTVGTTTTIGYMQSAIDTDKYSVTGNLDAAGCTVTLLGSTPAITANVKVPFN